MKKYRYTIIDFLFFFSLLFLSCVSSPSPESKPRSYPRMSLPQHDYESWTPAHCPFSFEVPTYSKIKQKKYFFNERASNDCWFNLEFPSLNSTLHLSYYPIKTPNSFDDFVQDAFKMSYEHTIRANAIEESLIDDFENNLHGFLFDLSGPAASPLQFFLTDTSSHFFRGALYINTQINRDSLDPLIDFLRDDIDHIISSFRWKE